MRTLIYSLVKKYRASKEKERLEEERLDRAAASVFKYTFYRDIEGKDEIGSVQFKGKDHGKICATRFVINGEGVGRIWLDREGDFVKINKQIIPKVTIKKVVGEWVVPK